MSLESSLWSSGFTADTVAASLLPLDSPEDLLPFNVPRDGNCLFLAVSSCRALEAAKVGYFHIKGLWARTARELQNKEREGLKLHDWDDWISTLLRTLLIRLPLSAKILQSIRVI